MTMSGEYRDVSCTVPRCNQIPYAKGLCFTHYMQVYRGGSPSPIRERNSNPPDTCTVPDCDKPYTARGLCMMHYQRQRRGRNVPDSTSIS